MNTSRLTMGYASYSDMKEKDSWESKKRINMFKIQNLYPTFMSSSKPYTGIIMPAFDPAYSPEDPARKTSWHAYRSNTEVIPSGPGKGLGAFTDWFIFVLGYAYYGEGMSTFVSPLTIGEDDPIQDIRKYIYSQKNKGITDYEYLVEKGKSRTDIRPIPAVSKLMLINVWSGAGNAKVKDQTVGNRVLVLKEQAANKLFSDLNAFRPAAIAQPFDADWPHFLYGDPTHPDHAIEVTSMEYTPAQGFPGTALNLGEMTMTSPGTMSLSSKRVIITEDMLSGRYELNDIENVLHIPTYEEMVDLLVEEAIIPYNLIKTVCSTKYNGAFPSAGGTRPSSASALAPAPAPAPAPVTPAPMATSPFTKDDEIPGLGTSSQTSHVAPVAQPAAAPTPTPAVTSSGEGPLTPAEKERLNELYKLITSGEAEGEHYSEFQKLNKRDKANL